MKQIVGCFRGSGSWIWSLYVSCYFITLWNVQNNKKYKWRLKKKIQVVFRMLTYSVFLYVVIKIYNCSTVWNFVSYSDWLGLIVFQLLYVTYIFFLISVLFSVYWWAWCLWFCFLFQETFFSVSCSSFLFVFSIVFQYMVEVHFSVSSCRGLSLRVYSDAPLTYVLYQFFLNCSHFSSKSITKILFKKETAYFLTYMLET